MCELALKQIFKEKHIFWIALHNVESINLPLTDRVDI